MSEPLPVLIVAAPGRRRESLCVLLRASRLVGAVWQADHDLARLTQPDGSPALVFIDADLAGEQLPIYVQSIQARWPAVKCCLLAHNGQQTRAARATGIWVLTDGFAAEVLWQMLEDAIEPGSAQT